MLYCIKVTSIVKMISLLHHYLKLFLVFVFAFYGIHSMYKIFFVWIFQVNIFRDSSCCPLKLNNGLLYKFDHYEDDFTDLTDDYGCMTGKEHNLVLVSFHQKVSSLRLCLCSAKPRTWGYWCGVLLQREWWLSVSMYW